ncbi:C40 family peptidase [Streptomyces sp. NPDC096012]|uniref:C40 family peptidase n=1 Tax=Streptomyces sp. NPDC096012 TaxID=3155684 RepID=UPI00336A4623
MAPENRDEVRRRIDYLYSQAEDATGNFNATRARAAGTRSRGVPLAKRRGRSSDPVLDEVARQWFDAARAELGPTVPAALPADRLPTAPAAPARSRDRVTDGLAPGRALERWADGRPDTALPGGERPALDTGPTGRLPELERGADRAVAELESGAGRTVAALEPAAGVAGFAAESTGGAVPDPIRLGGAPSVPEAPSFGTANTGAAVRGSSKSENRRKLAAARELLAGHTARGAVPDTGALTTLTAPEALAMPGAGAFSNRSTTGTGSLSALTDTGSLSAVTDTGSLTVFPGTGAFAAPAIDTGAFATPVTDTGSLTAYTDTGVFAAPVIDTGALPQWGTTGTAPLTAYTDTGVFAAPAIDTGALPQWGTTGTAPLTAYTGSGAFAQLGAVAGPLPVPVPESPRALRAAKAIAFARAQVGKPCVWGATGPDSYDCSSLTQAAWKAAGVTLPRAAHRQAVAGTPVTLAGLEPGDLVLFFDDDRHVGLHVGDGMMVHAPGPGSSITEESIYGAGEAAIHRIIRPA